MVVEPSLERGLQYLLLLSFFTPASNSLATANCLAPSQTQTDDKVINALFSNGGENTIINLCPNSTFILANSINFTASGQRLRTAGFPSDNTRAILLVTGSDQATAVQGNCNDCSNIVLRSVQVNGNRAKLGRLANGNALIEMGGPVSDQRIYQVHSYDPRGWSALHIDEGNLNCNGVRVLDNQIGPAGNPAGEWADGISYACTNGLVAYNTVEDATDGGIVVFQAPGTKVRNNTIIANTQVLMGGINLVDYEPYSGNYTGTVVSNNSINSTNAMIKVGIAIGPAVWGTSTNVVFGGNVSNNTLIGNNFGYGIGINGVKDFVVRNNTATGQFYGSQDFFAPGNNDPYPKCNSATPNPGPEPFLLNPQTSSGSFSGQIFAQSTSFSTLICIQPTVDITLASPSQIDSTPPTSIALLPVYSYPAGGYSFNYNSALLIPNLLQLFMQADNNLVLYNVSSGSRPSIWSTGTVQPNNCTNFSSCLARFDNSGNLNIVGVDGQTIWSTHTNDPNYPGKNLIMSSVEPFLQIQDALGDILWTDNQKFQAGQMLLSQGQFVQIGSSENNFYFLVIQGDGNFVMYQGVEYSGQIVPVWASNTRRPSGYCSPNCSAAFTASGNLQVYEGSQVLWQSGTSNFGGGLNFLNLSETAPYLNILSSSGNSLWNSGN